MKVILAKHAGFCEGVKRAMSCVLEIAAKSRTPVYTFGPLFHNDSALKKLEQKEILIKNKLEDIDDGDTIVIRTHGIPPDTRSALKSKSLNLHDLTCPKVGKVQSLVKKYSSQGCFMVIYGDTEHPEIVGLKGYAGENVAVVDDVGFLDILTKKGLPPDAPLCVLSQTTKKKTAFNNMCDEIRRHYKNVTILDTICDSSMTRQEEIYDLSDRAEAFVIVGGKNSSNTRILADLARSLNKPTFHVETADELPIDEMTKYDIVAVTAGASTPNWAIHEVVERLEASERKLGAVIRGQLRRIFNALLNSYTFLALGATALTLVGSRIAGYEVEWNTYMVTLIYVVAMFLAYNVINYGDLQGFDTERYAFYKRRKPGIIISTVLLISAVLLLTVIYDGMIPFLLVALSMIAGYLYQGSSVPSFLHGLVSYRKIKDIPASKEILIAGAITFISIMIPAFTYLSAVNFKLVLLAGGFIYVMVFIRTVLFSIRDIHGDMYLGRESLPVWLGKRNTKMLILLFLTIAGGVVLGSVLTNRLPFTGLWLLVNLAYMAMYLFLFHKRVMEKHKNLFTLVVDFNFILAGILVALFY